MGLILLSVYNRQWTQVSALTNSTTLKNNGLGMRKPRKHSIFHYKYVTINLDFQLLIAESNMF